MSDPQIELPLDLPPERPAELHALLPATLLYAIGSIAGVTKNQPLAPDARGYVCVSRASEDSLWISGNDGVSLITCDCQCTHSIPNGRAYVVTNPLLKSPTAEQRKQPYVVDLHLWSGDDPTQGLLHQVLEKFEADQRLGAFKPILFERMLRAMRTAGATGYVEITCARKLSRLTGPNPWGRQRITALVAGVELAQHKKEDQQSDEQPEPALCASDGTPHPLAQRNARQASINRSVGER